MTRLLVILIAVYVIYYLIKSSLKSKKLNSIKAENTSQSRTQKKYQEEKEGEFDSYQKEIAYIIYSSTKDDDTCKVCLSLDGKYLLPDNRILNDIRPPNSGCKNTNGCRCKLMYVTKDEEGSERIESFLKKHGGLCDKQALEKEVLNL